MTPPAPPDHLAEPLGQAQWAERFASELLRLGSPARRGLLAQLGFDLWYTHGHFGPEFAARAEFSTWPRTAA